MLASLVAWLIVLPPLVALAWFTIEVALGLKPLPFPRASDSSVLPSSVIVVPAHDEAAGIGATVAALRSAAYADCRVLVVADNCTDDTAAIARRAGADVIERFDSNLRGKGYALAFGRDFLAQTPPAVMIVVDADCRMTPGSIAALVAAVVRENRPAQAIDIIDPDLSLPPLAQISGFAFLVKNHARQRGLQRLGGFSLLCGTGMAFPWQDLAEAPLATGNVVEDLGLAVSLIGAGRRPLLVEAATVTSPAAGADASVEQRSRWEQGFLATARRQALPALRRGLARGHRADFALGMHLLVPPLALLMILSLAALALSGAWGAVTAFWLPTQVLAAVFAAALVLVFAVWWQRGRSTLSFRALLNVPFYVLWKLPIYLRLVSGQRQGWTRTRR